MLLVPRTDSPGVCVSHGVVWVFNKMASESDGSVTSQKFGLWSYFRLAQSKIVLAA